MLCQMSTITPNEETKTSLVSVLANNKADYYCTYLVLIPSKSSRLYWGANMIISVSQRGKTDSEDLFITGQ